MNVEHTYVDRVNSIYNYILKVFVRLTDSWVRGLGTSIIMYTYCYGTNNASDEWFLMNIKNTNR